MGKREERKRHSRRRASINIYGVSGTSGLSVLLELAVQEREKKKKDNYRKRQGPDNGGP